MSLLKIAKRCQDFMPTFLIPALFGLVLVSGCNDNKPSAEDVEEVDTLQVGMCFNDPKDEDIIIDENNNVLATQFDIINCNEPHDNEMYYFFDLPDAEEYVETDSLVNSMLDVCEDKFAGYIGRDYQQSFYEMSIMPPTVESWKQGDRQVVCFAFHPEGDKIQRSLKNIKE